MKTASLQFKNAIKNNMREIDTRIIFYNGNDKYVIRGNDVQSNKYNTSVEKELGGIEKKILNLTLIKNTISDKIIKGTVLYRETWVKYNDNWYSDFQEKFIVVSRKGIDSKNVIKIEAVDELTIIRSTPLPYLAQTMNIDLISYFNTLLSIMTNEHVLDANLANPMLSLAFPKSTNTHETLLEMCVASQGILKSDFTVKKFVAADPVDRLNYGQGLLKYEFVDSDLNTYKDVIISLFSPTKKTFKSLGSIMTTIPPSAVDYKLGNIEFDKLYIPQLITFNQEVEIANYTIGSKTCSLTITSRLNELMELETEFLGLDVNSVSAMSENTENKTKFVNNIYIQSPTVYDTFIYTAKGINIKYTGNTLYEVGDTILVDDKYKVFIVDHNLDYSGGLKGTIKGVLIDG
jgi:hypothetical protein